jgi:serine phosphatase RsbU (regulator of sigma subunit)
MADLVSDVALLTTELVTNGVIHAGTDLEIELAADECGVLVTVVDGAPGRPVLPRPDRSPAEPDGRGLFLVHLLATQWGTTHHADRKSVWFQMDHKDRDAQHTGVDRLVAAISELLGVSARHKPADAPVFCRALLQTLARVAPVYDAVVRIDRGDGAGPLPVAQLNTRQLGDGPPIRIPLELGTPWSGELSVFATDNQVTRTLAALTAERLSSALHAQRLHEADRSRRAWLAYLADVDTMLSHSSDLSHAAALIPHLVVPRLAVWSALHVVDRAGHLALAAAVHADEAQTGELAATLRTDTVTRRLAELPCATGMMPISIDHWPSGNAMTLTARDQPIGVLTAGLAATHQGLEHLAMLEEVARRSARALDNARIHDERERIARVLQRSLLPPELPPIPGVDLAAEYVPTQDQIEVGGDFYDVAEMGDGRVLILVGDVAGKGVEAAAITGLVREVIRVLIADGKPHGQVLDAVNRTLTSRTGGQFCTLVLAMLERRLDGELIIQVYLAGHDRAIHIGPDRPATPVGYPGTLLGVYETIELSPCEVRLRPDEALVLYTDGVTERRNGRELFGPDRLLRTLAPLSGYPASVVAAQLKAVTMAFSDTPPQDDIAILVIRNEP